MQLLNMRGDSLVFLRKSVSDCVNYSHQSRYSSSLYLSFLC